MVPATDRGHHTVSNDQTLIRVWRDDETESTNLFVDWHDGRFSLPWEHPFSRHMWGSGRMLRWRITVYSTEELEWSIDRIDYSHSVEYNCIPRRERLRLSLVSDDALIGMWLDAEQEWLKQPAAAEDAVIEIDTARAEYARWFVKRHYLKKRLDDLYSVPHVTLSEADLEEMAALGYPLEEHHPISRMFMRYDKHQECLRTARYLLAEADYHLVTNEGWLRAYGVEVEAA